MKQYRFKVLAKLTKTDGKSLLSNIIATSIIDAKNKVKAMHPEAVIYSCVKCEEYTDPKQKLNQATKSKSNNSENSSSMGSVLLGAAVAAGIGLFLKNK